MLATDAKEFKEILKERNKFIFPFAIGQEE